MVCRYCGYELRDGALICVKCGRPVSEQDWPEGYTPVSAEDMRKTEPVRTEETEIAEESPIEKEPSQPGMPAGDPVPAFEVDEEEQEDEFPLPSVFPPEVAAEPVLTPETDGEEEHLVDRALTWGVIALVFGLSMVLSPIGVVAGLISRHASKGLSEKHGVLTGRARTGQTLGRAGLILAIVLTVLMIGYVLMLQNAVQYLEGADISNLLSGLEM